MRVKICGITNYEDAVAAIEMGAHFLGFNFYPKSPRFLQPEKAAEVIVRLPACVDIVGVFVNAAMAEIRRTMEQCQLNWVQLHGDEAPQFCRELGYDSVKVIKALRVGKAEDVQKMNDYFTDAILLDAFDPAKYGGTGVRFDWSVITGTNRRIFLAGGIAPDNAAEAAATGVYAIDVCSGVESEPGRKDHTKMRMLFDNIRHLR